jgi:eukaryotic-like serine/threonine-protein kinase
MPEMIGKYEVVKLIGRGGMGTIYQARDSVLERSVALKVVSSLEVTPELRTRFFREAQACARLSHPNIVTIHDMGEDGGRLFIVMELLEGEELRQLIARRAPLELEEKLTVLRQLCDGLSFAHQKGIVHRDIKPANIFLVKNGRVKILDFGIAQIAAVATQGDLTRTGMIMGTLRYMAPEQVRGRADHRSDIFSVAAVAYELLGGRPPFTGQDPLQILEQLRTEVPPPLAELEPSLPPELSTIVERGMQKDPENRFADLGQMAQQLELVRRKLAAEPKRPPVHRQLLDPPDRYKAPAEPRDPPAPEAPAPVAPAVKIEEPVSAAPPAVEPVSVAQSTSRGTPARAAVSTPPTGGDHIAATGFWPREDDESAPEADVPWFRRVPLVAIGTGVAVAAIAVIAVFAFRPATSPPDRPAATVATDQAEKKQAADARNAPTAPRNEATRAADDKQAEATRSLPARPESESRAVDNRAANAPASQPALPPATPPTKTLPGTAAVPKPPAPTPAAPTPAPTPPAPMAPAPPPAGAKTPTTPATPSTATPTTAPPAKSRSESASPSAAAREQTRTSAVDPAVAGARDEAEQARVRMNAARRTAEQAAAGFYARKRFTSAQDKERDAMTALGRSEYAGAARLFGEAQSEYQAAVKESALEADLTAQAAKLRTNLDEAHAAAAARRQQALAAGADNLARDVFDRAQARQVEGDEMATRKDLAGAARAYREAAERYGEAMSRARAARPAR